MTNSIKIKEDIFLVNQKIESTSIKKADIKLNTHHIFVIDCSGSMYDELPKIRKDLYNKISTDLDKNDSLTIIWFSGKGQCGVILEDYNIKSNISITKVKGLIDKYLTPVGLTAFKDALDEANVVVKKVLKEKPNFIHSLFFITDGYDNQYSTKEILQASNTLKEQLASSTIIEYGWYCNRELLAKMACEMGGIHIFSEDFQDYEPYIKKQFVNQITSKRKYVKIVGSVDHGNVFSLTKEGEVISYSLNENNEIFIGEDVERVYYFSKYPYGEEIQINMLSESVKLTSDLKDKHDDWSVFVDALYAGLFSFSRIGDYNKVSEILKFIGDARFITQKANTFGSQKINELEAEFLKAVKDKKMRFVYGYNPDLEPSEDAYCVLDMIQDLMDNDENLWYPRHESFQYKRIGSKSVAKQIITDKTKEEVESLLKDGKFDDLKNKIDEIANQEALKFQYEDDSCGYPIADLVWNEERANLSVQVMYKGFVNLPDNKFSILPKEFKTQKFRNYTLIKDGIIHSYVLPVSLSEETFYKLQKNNLLQGETYEKNKIYILDFSSIPVVNRKMIDQMSAEKLFRDEYELLKLKAKNTVFNHYKKSIIGKSSFDFIEKFGEEATAWLKEIGITASGFNPPSTVEKTNEEILVSTLKVKIDKLTLMTAQKDFQKVLDKIKSGEELTPREALLKPAIEEFESFMKSMEGIDDTKIVESWIDKKSKLIRKRKNELMSEISKIKFLSIIGKVWFKEFKSRDEKEMVLNIDGMDIKFQIEDQQKTIKI
ncbi:MAG: vWA domain-containing protein [Candidatus Izemoplasmatales bacterium]